MRSPTSILFQTELCFPPIAQMAIGKDRIRGLFNKMFETGGYPYEQLRLTGDKPGEKPGLFTQREKSAASLVQFDSHSVTIEERQPSFGVDEFVGIVNTVMRGLEHPWPIFMQKCRVQCTLPVSGSENSIELLAERVARVSEKLAPFERMPSYFGVRFRFAPVDDDDSPDSAGPGDPELESEPTENQGFITLRFETHSKDLKSVWMEAEAVYPSLDFLSVPEDLGRIGKNIEETHRFLAVKGKNFLDQFDHPTLEQGGG